MGSDVLIINNRVKYPTGEQILVKYKTMTKVQLAKHSLKIPMLIAEINNDCILGVDFLKLFYLQNIFDSIFLSTISEISTIVKCFRVENITAISVLSNVMTLFKKEVSQHLNELEKEDFISFLNEFRDIFSDNVFAGNHKLEKHVIKVKDSFIIKQAPRFVFCCK